jgi:hypothetical protein
MKFIIGNSYTFKFAGETIHCKLFNIEKTEIEDEYLYWFTDNKYKYPIRKQNICGNSTQ